MVNLLTPGQPRLPPQRQAFQQHPQPPLQQRPPQPPLSGFVAPHWGWMLPNYHRPVRIFHLLDTDQIVV